MGKAIVFKPSQEFKKSINTPLKEQRQLQKTFSDYLREYGEQILRVKSWTGVINEAFYTVPVGYTFYLINSYLTQSIKLGTDSVAGARLIWKGGVLLELSSKIDIQHIGYGISANYSIPLKLQEENSISLVITENSIHATTGIVGFLIANSLIF